MRTFLKFLIGIGVSLPLFANTQLTFNGLVNPVDGVALEFGLSQDVESKMVSKMSHKLPFVCSPSIKGVVEYKQKSLIFYTKDLHAGLKYDCVMNNSNVNFETQKFGVYDVKMINLKEFIMSFNDSVNLEELNKSLNIDGANFSAKKLSKYDFLITLDSNLKNPKFSLPADFKSEFNATLPSKWDYTYEAKNKEQEVINFDTTRAKTITLNKPEAVSLDGGKLGVRVYLRDWIRSENLKKFVKVDGVNRFSLSDTNYIDYSRPNGLSEDINYYIDIVSDEFKPQTEYKISILNGFGDEYSVVRETKEFIIKMGDLAPYAKFISEQPYISSLGEIGIKSANVGEVKVVIEKVMEQNYRYFLNLNQENLSSLTKEIASKNYELGGILNEEATHSLKFDFKDGGDGIYLVTLYYDKDKSIQKAVYFSDIAISAKVAKDEIFVFANRLSQNAMVGGANVKIYSTKNDLITAGATNDEGVFKFNKKDIYKEVGSVVVSLANEQNFLIINQDERLNEEAYYKSESGDESVSGYVYFASNIIRPNENIKGVIYLRDDKFKPLKNMPIKLRISDPQGKRVSELPKTSNEFGVVSFDESVLSSLSGTFGFSVIYANKIIKNENFFIESFVPSRIKNEVVLPKDSYLNNEILIANLNSNYLFGAAASSLSGDVEMFLYDDEFKDERYKEFKFINATIKNLNTNSVLKPIVLDVNGKADVVFSLSLQNDVASVVKGYLKFGINDDGNIVNGGNFFTLYPYTSVVGITANTDFTEPNKPVKFKTIALDSLTKEPKSTVVKFEIKRLAWEYNVGSNGELRWFETYEKLDEIYSQKDELEYKFSQSGEYVIIATDTTSGASASFDVSVSGYDYSTLAPTKELSKANIKLNAKEYKKGEEISVDVSSTIKDGLCMVTLEADGVKAYKLIVIKNHSANAKFTLDFDFIGGYISASIYRVADSGSTPFRTNAKTYIKAKADDKTIKVSLDTPKVAKTNEKVKVQVKTNSNADISLFVADIGVLNITSQSSPNPLKFFLKKVGDGVFDYDIYSKLTGFKVGGKILSFGGGAMAAMLDKHESPVDSKNVETFVKMARLKADANGTAIYEFETPNGFNSAIRVDAIASDESGYGVASSEIAVKDDIVIKPTTLTYLIKGDEINAKLRLINNTNLDKNITLDTNSSENLSLKLEKNNINLKPLDSISVNLKIKANELGKANFVVSANDKDVKFSNKNKLDVINAYPISTFAKSMSVSKETTIKLPNGYKEVTINASNNVSAVLKNISKNLVSYPYGCVEQRSSRLLALLYAKTSGADEEDRLRFIKFGLMDLAKMQTKNGSFGYWNELSDVNKFASIYATDVILELSRAGFDVPKDVISNALHSLKKMEYDTPTQQLYATYLLSKQNRLEKDVLNEIYDSGIYKKSDLDIYLMAATLKNSGLNADAKNTLKELGKKSIKGSPVFENFDSDIRNRAFILHIHANSFEPNDYSDKLASTLLKSVDDASSTQERAFLLRALSEYFKDNGKTSDKFKLAYNSTTQEFEKIGTVSITPKDGEFKILPNEKLFISVSSTAYVPLATKHAKETRELDIYRTFVDKNGKEIQLDTLKTNDIIYSKAELKSISNINVGVINEIVSPCFEVINESLTGEKRNEAVKNSLDITHQNIKDDRVVSFYELKANQSGTIYTPYRVVLSGKCMLPAIITENMYNEAQTDYDLAQKSFKVAK